MYCPDCGSKIQDSPCRVCATPMSPDALPRVASTVQLAGWWRRVGATLIDDAVLIIPTMIVADMVNLVAGVWLAILAAIAVEGVYMVKLLASPRGQTLGNRAVATRVIDGLTGQAITNRQAIRRWSFVAAYGLIGLSGAFALGLLVAVVGLADMLLPLFDARRQTLHDKYAGTIVVLT